MFVVQTSEAEAKRLRKSCILVGVMLVLLRSIGGVLTMHIYVKPRPIPQGVRLFGFRLTRGSPTTRQRAEARVMTNANGWHYAEGENTFGPVDLKEIQVVFSKISDPRNLLVWKAGFKDWERAGNVPELAGLIYKPPPLPQTSQQPRKK